VTLFRLQSKLVGLNRSLTHSPVLHPAVYKNENIKYKRVRVWPLQDIVLLLDVCARINRPFIPRLNPAASKLNPFACVAPSCVQKRNKNIKYKRVRVWPLQDIVLLLDICARINRPFIPRLNPAASKLNPFARVAPSCVQKRNKESTCTLLLLGRPPSCRFHPRKWG